MTAHTYATRCRHRGLQPFLWTQFLGAFNDNLFKIVVSMLAVHAATPANGRARAVARRRGLHPAVPALLRLRGPARRRLQQAHRAGRHQVARDRRGRRSACFAFIAGHLESDLRRALPDRAAGDVLQPGEIRHPPGDAARPRPVARERPARDEHVRRDRRSARRSAASCSTRWQRPALDRRPGRRRRRRRRHGDELRHSARPGRRAGHGASRRNPWREICARDEARFAATACCG